MRERGGDETPEVHIDEPSEPRLAPIPHDPYHALKLHLDPDKARACCKVRMLRVVVISEEPSVASVSVIAPDDANIVLNKIRIPVRERPVVGEKSGV